MQSVCALMSVHGQARSARGLKRSPWVIGQVIESLRRINRAGKEAPKAAAGIGARAPNAMAGVESGTAALKARYGCKFLKALRNLCQK